MIDTNWLAGLTQDCIGCICKERNVLQGEWHTAGLRLSIVCRQLGTELHELQPALPLFDGVTGQAVPQSVDTRVERLRDALMDDARERVDDLGEDLVVGMRIDQHACISDGNIDVGMRSPWSHTVF